MRELRVGDRVQTPRGTETVVSCADGTACTSDDHGSPAWWDRDDIWPLTPPDIPRERVEALHAAVRKRMEQLEAAGIATHFASERDILAACHSDLSEVAESLRLLLEVDP